MHGIRMVFILEKKFAKDEVKKQNGGYLTMQEISGKAAFQHIINY